MCTSVPAAVRKFHGNQQPLHPTMTRRTPRDQKWPALPALPAVSIKPLDSGRVWFQGDSHLWYNPLQTRSPKKWGKSTRYYGFDWRSKIEMGFEPGWFWILVYSIAKKSVSMAANQLKRVCSSRGGVTLIQFGESIMSRHRVYHNPVFWKLLRGLLEANQTFIGIQLTEPKQNAPCLGWKIPYKVVPPQTWTLAVGL